MWTTSFLPTTAEFWSLSPADLMTVVLALLQTAVILEEFVVVEVAEAVVPAGNRAVEEMFHTEAGGKAPGDRDNDAEPGPSGMWHVSELTEAQKTLPLRRKCHITNIFAHIQRQILGPMTLALLLTVVNLYVLPYMEKQRRESGYQTVLHIRN
jgi:hypothetical protein